VNDKPGDATADWSNPRLAPQPTNEPVVVPIVVSAEALATQRTLKTAMSAAVAVNFRNFFLRSKWGRDRSVSTRGGVS
jgi:hypothetical protein